ncbi:hypothetical protein WJX75_008209 [Coccomyxa subellipsoidea]|uniref:Myb-like domain-containing protein n=1 Tax=Coccomyxa subellipsoidea TaxID=248742 RepID=A0ABR2YFE7_9CHLO
MSVRCYRVWTAEEEEALRKGVQKHGIGSWEIIRQDANYRHLLADRTGVQLKDKGRTASAEPLVEIERQRQENIARNKQALAALMSNVEQPQASTARRRRPPISNGDQWHEVQEQLLHAFDALAGAVGENVVAEAAALACSQAADCASAQDSERQDCRRASKRTAALERKRYSDYEYDVDVEGDDGAASPTESSSPKRFRHTRFTTEDRRFGIYDERRYQANGMLQHARTSPRPRPSPAPGKAAAVETQEERDSGMVDCPCGITFDDGQAMIECERCKVWAHLVCLQVQMSQHPRHFHYNFSHYMCDLCQHELRVQAAQVGSRSGRVSPRSTSSIAHRKTTLACTRPEAFSSSLPPAQPSLSNARVHRVVPSSGGQPLASASPFAKASHSAKSQRKNGHDSWGTSAAHSRKADGYSGDEKPMAERPGGRVRSSTVKSGRSGRGRGPEADEAPEHPARLLDNEDARHYSGFLGHMSGSDELSMDVPDLLASLLELGGAVPNAAARGASPALPARPPKAAPSGHWESSAEGPAARRGRERQHRHPAEHVVRSGHHWDGGREQWETPTVPHHSSRRPSDVSLPLHEAWMQHEAEWASMHGLRHPAVPQEGARMDSLKWGERNLRTPRQPRTSRVLWPSCLEPLVARPGQASGRANAAPPSLWEPSPLRKKPRKANHHAQQASSSSQSPASPHESSGQLHHLRDDHHRLSPSEPQFTSRRLPHSRSHRDINGRRHSSHGRGDSPPARLPNSTPGGGSGMEHRGGQLGHLNGRMTLPASLPLGDMPMEALDAALAGLDDHDPHHELALDQAAMDLHDNDEVQAGELEQVVSGASEGSGGQLARTSSHYMGPVASDSLAHTWMHHAWADAGHVLNRQSLPPKKAAAAAASAAAEAQAAADAAAEAVGVAFGAEDMGGNLGVSELDSRPDSPSPKDEGLGDLAAHLVAFHNMGASPSHDDPFVSGGKVSFDDEGPNEGGDGGQSPRAHNSQAYNTSPLLDQDRAFDGSDRATPLGLVDTEEGEGKMYAEVDQMLNVNQDALSDLEGDAYSDAAHTDTLEAA